MDQEKRQAKQGGEHSSVGSTHAKNERHEKSEQYEEPQLCSTVREPRSVAGGQS